MEWSNLSIKSQNNTISNNVSTAVFIHGANQSSLSSEYLKSNCNFKKKYFVNYSSSERFFTNLEIMVEDLKKFDQIFIVGHSMGGLYGIYLTQHIKVAGGVSISTPFGGSFTADWARYFIPTYPLFKDVGRRSRPVADSKKIKLDIPWTQIVTTTGSVPYHGSKNDGVVTIDSMTARTDVEYVEVEHNHYEVVFSKKVANIINARYYSLTDC